MSDDRVVLGSWPTPIERATRLGAALGLDNFWIKRDDLTGLGAGGNKVRKLEWTVGAALADGADTLVTTGAAQSNHARLTAAAGARLGLDVVLVLPGGAPRHASGNLTLDGLFGASLLWTDDLPAGDAVDADDESALAALMDRVADELRVAGRRPAVIPFGGSNAVGAHGYRVAAAEILAQLPEVDHVVVALGSGGTMAGLVAGLGPDRVLGVHTGAVPDPRSTVSALLDAMPDAAVDRKRLRIRTDQVGTGYSDLAPGAAAALKLAGDREGIVLDPIYTARALAGLMAAVGDGEIGPGESVLFLHTGGLPGLFGHPAAVEQANSGLRSYG